MAVEVRSYSRISGDQLARQGDIDAGQSLSRSASPSCRSWAGLA